MLENCAAPDPDVCLPICIGYYDSCLDRCNNISCNSTLQVYNASNSAYNITVPRGCTQAVFSLCGGGGSGGNQQLSSGGGGADCLINVSIPVTSPNVVARVGFGGSSVPTGDVGITGQVSTITIGNLTLTAYAGAGGDLITGCSGNFGGGGGGG